MSQSAHAALVVSLHARSLSELRARASPDHAAKLQEHVNDERARQARLCELLGVSESALERTRRQMWTWDGLSLALCNAWRPFTAKEVPGRDGPVDVELRDRGDGATTLDPWPLAAESVEVRCEARRIAGRFESELAMREALASARPVTLAFELVAP